MSSESAAIAVGSMACTAPAFFLSWIRSCAADGFSIFKIPALGCNPAARHSRTWDVGRRRLDANTFGAPSNSLYHRRFYDEEGFRAVESGGHAFAGILCRAQKGHVEGLGQR